MKFKIGYFADGPWSHTAFEKIIQDDSLKIEFIVPRTDTTDKTLENFASIYKIDYLHHVDVNSSEFFEKASTYKCDLFVSMSFNQIFRDKIINLPKQKTINCHAGKLPFYRGRNVLNWVLINDEKDFGITVHFVDKGIDTGDIILQRSFEIKANDTYRDLLELAYIECAEILYDSIKLMQNGSTKAIKQSEIDPVGFYCGRRSEGDEIINWNQPSRDIYNFIRAICSPGPKGRSVLNGIEVKINKSRFIDNVRNYKGTPGQILAKTSEGYLVKTADTFIEILEIECDTKIRVGDKFK